MATLSNIKLNKFSKDYVLEVDIKITKQFKVRMFLAIQLIRLAAFFMGTGVKYDINKDKASAG